MNEKEADILEHGITSDYWEEYTQELAWEKESTQAKLYIAGTLSGFSHEFVLKVMLEQASIHGAHFKNLGFFIWKDFFSQLKSKTFEVESSYAKEMETRKPDGMKVINIPYEDYRRIAIDERNRFPYLFLANGDLDEELLGEIHFNATHSMSSADIKDKYDKDAFIAGTLVGCSGVKLEELVHTNEMIRQLGW